MGVLIKERRRLKWEYLEFIMNWLKKLRALQNFVMLDILSKEKQLYPI
jgi:hypothetical protein